ncbi:MAG: UTP--glucose-1-phosphate uridylyltransferase GalU [Betaproteobacteria bacterium]|nr:UTP--glucose-1-phosphate uridylyltransferase GalU [Betaproteobacteria bacterium]
MSKFSGKVRKAVFPVAGLGTRFLPATKASPKEMLPVVDKPLIQYAVEEAAAAGITDMIFITGRSKRAIEDHFDKAYELEAELEAKNKQQLLEVVRGVAPGSINCIYIRQPEALGLGHAVLCAEPVVGDEPFAILLADDLMDAGEGGVPVMRQMVEQFERHHSSVIAVEEVPLQETAKYGIVSTAATGGASLETMTGIVEKPRPEAAPSRLAVVGRYLLTARIFDLIRQQSAGAGGEIQLTDAIARLLKEEPVLAYRFQGRRFDCGAKLGYMQASVTLAQRHPEIGTDFARWLGGDRL